MKAKKVFSIILCLTLMASMCCHTAFAASSKYAKSVETNKVDQYAYTFGSSSRSITCNDATFKIKVQKNQQLSVMPHCGYDKSRGPSNCKYISRTGSWVFENFIKKAIRYDITIIDGSGKVVKQVYGRVFGSNTFCPKTTKTQTYTVKVHPYFVWGTCNLQYFRNGIQHYIYEIKNDYYQQSIEEGAFYAMWSLSYQV